jgi:hypothetical protein
VIKIGHPLRGNERVFHGKRAASTYLESNQVPGGITGPPCSWGIYIQEPGRPGWGSLKSETVKCGHESRGTRT